MSDLIERAARAHYTCRARDLAKAYPARMGVAPVTWDDLPESVREIERGHMRAAIEAMREPTEAMIDAAYLGEPATNEIARRGTAQSYRAMISAALNEGEKP